MADPLEPTASYDHLQRLLKVQRQALWEAQAAVENVLRRGYSHESMAHLPEVLRLALWATRCTDSELRMTELRLRGLCRPERT